MSLWNTLTQHWLWFVQYVRQCLEVNQILLLMTSQGTSLWNTDLVPEI